MGVRKTGICPPPKIGIENRIFQENCKSAGLIPIQTNWFNSCNDSWFAGMKLTLHKNQVHRCGVMQW